MKAALSLLRVADGRSYVRFMQHWASQHNSVLTEAAAAGEAVPAAPAVASAGSSSSRVRYDKKLLIDLAAAAGADHKDHHRSDVFSTLSTAPAAAVSTSAIHSPLAEHEPSHTSGKLEAVGDFSMMLPTAAAAVPLTLGWSKDAAAFLSNSTSSGNSSSAAVPGAQHSHNSYAAETPAAVTAHLTPSQPSAAAAAAAAAADQSAPAATCPPATDLKNYNINSSSSSARLTPQALAAGLTDVPGLSGQPGCASLSVLPFTDVSSTAAEADEMASLQPTISVASTTSTVISSCLSTHAGSLKEKPSWHGVQLREVPMPWSAINSSSSSPALQVPAGVASTAMHAAAAEAPAAASKQQQQQQQASKELDCQLLPAAPAADASGKPTGLIQNHTTAPNPTPDPKPFPYTPDPLYATRVAPNSWLGGLKAAVAAVAQVRAEQRHIKQALLQRQGMLPTTKASFCGLGGGSKAAQQVQLLGSGAVTSSNAAKDVSGNGTLQTAAAAAGSGGSSGRLKAAAVDTSSLSTQLLHISEATLQKLKVRGCSGELQLFIHCTIRAAICMVRQDTSATSIASKWASAALSCPAPSIHNEATCSSEYIDHNVFPHCCTMSAVGCRPLPACTCTACISGTSTYHSA
jgi:hypothetical protein